MDVFGNRAHTEIHGLGWSYLMLINPEMTIGLWVSPHALGQPLEHCNACGERNEGMYIAMEPSFVWLALNLFGGVLKCDYVPLNHPFYCFFHYKPSSYWGTLMILWRPPFQQEKHVQIILGLCVKPGDPRLDILEIPRASNTSWEHTNCHQLLVD
jgi:hypothetical protein